MAQHQTLTLELDRRKPSLRLGITSHAGLKVALDAALAFDRKTRALRCDVKGDLPPLGAPSPLLAKAKSSLIQSGVSPCCPAPRLLLRPLIRLRRRLRSTSSSVLQKDIENGSSHPL